MQQMLVFYAPFVTLRFVALLRFISKHRNKILLCRSISLMRIINPPVVLIGTMTLSACDGGE